MKKFVIVVVVVILLFLGYFLYEKMHYEKKFEEIEESGTFINCMPILSSEEKKICDIAEKKGYPFIAY